jgi:hypothetical protein
MGCTKGRISYPYANSPVIKPSDDKREEREPQPWDVSFRFVPSLNHGMSVRGRLDFVANIVLLVRRDPSRPWRRSRHSATHDPS